MKNFIALILTLTFSQAPALARAGDECTPAKVTFESMNRPMFVGPKATPADVAAYEKTKHSTTEALHRFVIRSVLSELQRIPSRDTTTVIVNWVRCLQSGIPQYARAADWSNIPAAYSLPADVPRILLAYAIDRGYEAIPQTTYFLEVYSADNEVWQLSYSETPHEFDAGSLNVHNMTSGPSGQHRFLLAGRHFGDTGARLYLELLGFDGRAFEALWSEVRPRTWVVRISQEDVVLGSEVVDKNGRNAHEVTTTFTVDEHGLQPVR